MIRRWIIRCCFILPILLCVAGWAWSVTHDSWVECHGYGETWDTFTAIICGTRAGCVYAQQWGGSRGSVGEWDAATEEIPFEMVPAGSPRKPLFLGFGLGPDREVDLWYLRIPYWFLVVTFSTVLFLVWRKTKPPATTPAFPVEVGKTE